MEQPLLHCPHCGADLEIGSVLHAGRFSYSTHGGFRTDGTLLKSGGAVHIVLGQIMAGRGMLVTEEALRATTGTKATSRSNVVAVQLSRAKRTMIALGLDWPVHRIPGEGWSWVGPPVT